MFLMVVCFFAVFFMFDSFNPHLCRPKFRTERALEDGSGEVLLSCDIDSFTLISNGSLGCHLDSERMQRSISLVKITNRVCP